MIPDWLLFNKASLTLYGTPTKTGLVKIRINAQDTYGATAYQDFELEIFSNPPKINRNNTVQNQID